MRARLIRDKAGQWHRQPYEFPEPRELMPCQLAGIEWIMSRPAGLLADEMGVGKSAQAVGAINRLPWSARILIVCPAGLRPNWLRELAVWLTQERKARVAKRYLPECPIVILSYDLLAKFEVPLRDLTWDLAILDESHYLRNPWTNRCRQVIGDQWTLPINAAKKLLLTGTPISNCDSDLWPLLFFLGLDVDRQRFIWRAKHDPLWLQAVLRWYMLRRLKADVMQELPPKERRLVRIEAAGEARAAVAAEKNFQRSFGLSQKFQGTGFVETTAMRLKTAHAKIGMPVVQELLISGAQSAGKLVVFCVHRSVAMRLCEIFEEKRITAAAYHGGLNPDQRQKIVDDFQAGPLQVVIVTSAGWVGITLTAARYGIFVESSWDPAETAQAEDRLHRKGQRNAVTIDHLVIDGSIDCREIEIQIQKQEVIDRTINASAA